MSFKKRRLWHLALMALFFGGAALVVLTTLNDHLLFFMTPTDALMKKPTTPIRLGGLVDEGSLYGDGNLGIIFQITDGQNAVSVRYQGIVPDLFREGQGVVAEGVFSKEGVFQATRLLARHDERYMPRDVAEALKSSGQWRHRERYP